MFLVMVQSALAHAPGQSFIADTELGSDFVNTGVD